MRHPAARRRDNNARFILEGPPLYVSARSGWLAGNGDLCRPRDGWLDGLQERIAAVEETALTDASHHLYSSLREKIVEHVFVGDALRALWRRGVFNVEVLRSEFDAHGYDLVMGRDAVVRHIQFKTGVRPKPGRVSIPRVLSEKPSGCVIWIQVSNGLDMRRFWWFGGRPGEPLPPLGDRVAKRIGRKAEGVRPLREGHRVLNGSAFLSVKTLDEVLELLFGDLPSGLSIGIQY